MTVERSTTQFLLIAWSPVVTGTIGIIKQKKMSDRIARCATLYHYLRYTFGTMMAEMNTPTHLLCNHMGHGNIHVTQQYYIAISKNGIDILRTNLNKL